MSVLGVNAGAKLLDMKKPGWQNSVKLRRLHMVSWNKCILGQVYGYYGTGLGKLSLGKYSAHYYGFTATNDLQFLLLHMLWCLATIRRRVSASARKATRKARNKTAKILLQAAHKLQVEKEEDK